ncbi:uncharacterized protein I206_106519 [Kwoniella pini CBS 10737]|uniref:DUF1308 domain-containing protein n=1 Tax=Kwoniella pini CBS 10737 TaxID=1296096 RepID=A0A1B9HS83_9TREE|nr:uncharacterized protein I206_07906 [Kwoniella pini CBS 10737]OCF46121.1 hypothetical protein I206_07906 [Kwoniella pini CBS 10737]
MDQLSTIQSQIEELLISVEKFINEESELAIYKAPIIDFHHPNSYKQQTIIGLKKFLLSVENERDYIESLSKSKIPPKEISSNIPHLIAVWDQIKYAKWPIIGISQLLNIGDEKDKKNQVKVDLIENGGLTWVKVNTIKESRLMAEFREQDSYINSDYDSDSDTGTSSSHHSSSQSSSSNNPSVEAGPSKLRKPSLTNSAIEQAILLVQAAQQYPRIAGFAQPKVRYVLNRLEENPDQGYTDPRIKETFQIIRDLGVELVLASDKREAFQRPIKRQKTLQPTNKILLDLSVVVALCCESTHLELPTSSEELESRFRTLQYNSQTDEVELAEHIPVTKDLRDQLELEMKHPLIQELIDHLKDLKEEEVEFWVTDEVKNRLPAIVDIIGGETEKRRASIMFNNHLKEDFWQGSRWKNKIPSILQNLKVNSLPFEINGLNCSIDKFEKGFYKGFIIITKKMLNIIEIQSNLPELTKEEKEIKKKKFGRGKRRSKRNNNNNNKNIHLGISLESKLPSSHTLKTFLVGLEKGWTILTNNRGAVGKVLREMKIDEGLGNIDFSKNKNQNQNDDNDDDNKICIWVVNPSSLSEWRRKEVEDKNKKLIEYLNN